MKFFKIVLILLIIPFQTFAESPPSSCKEGAITQTSWNWPGSIINWIPNQSEDFLKAIADRYVLNGSQLRLKADGQYFTSRNLWITFQDDMNSTSFLHEELTNLEGNAYHTYTALDVSKGKHWFWVTRDNGWCSKRFFYLQDKPEITQSSTFSFNSSTEKFEVSLSYSVDDQYSKAAVETGQDVVVTFRLQHQLYGTISYETKSYSSLSGSVNLSIEPNDGAGWYSLSVEVMDGAHSVYQGKSIETPFGYCLPKC